MRFRGSFYSTRAACACVRASLLVTAAWGLSATGAIAQTTDDSESEVMETIVVTGIRASLQDSAAIKRGAEGVVDVISAEDIGKFPDKNIGEALQRVTGVQISRDNGEGRLINIRGAAPELNRVEFNGSLALSTDYGGGRQVDFRDFPAEFVSRIEVLKSQAADVTEGGIGGTVRIFSRMPLDNGGDDYVTGTAQGQYSDLSETFDPRIALFGSKSFADNTFGILGGIVFDQRTAHSHQTRSTGWTQQADVNGDGQNEYIPFIPRPVTVREDNDRFAINAIAQWQPSDDLNFYVEGLYTARDYDKSDQLLQVDVRAANIDPTGATIFPDGLTASHFDAVTFDADGDGYFDSGDRNLSVSHRVLNDTFRNKIWNVAFGGDYDVSDDLALSGRVTTSEMNYDQDVIAHVFGVNMIPRATVDLNNEYRAPNITFNGFDIYDRDNITSADSQDHVRQFTQKVTNAKFDADWAMDRGALDAVEFGFEYTDYSTSSFSERERRTLRAFDDPGVDLAQRQADLDNIQSAYDQFAEFTGIPFFKTVDLGFPQLNLIWINNGIFDAINAPTAVSNFFLDTWEVTEKTWAGYGKANFNFDLGSFPADAHIGVRYVHTSVNSDGLDSTGQAVAFKGDYTDTLPSAGINVHFTDDFLARVTYSTLLARAQPAQIAPRLSVSTLESTASRGNPSLDPYQADQFDVSLEYYLSNISYVGVAIFRKDVSSFISTGSIEGMLPGYGNQVFLISQPENNGDGVTIDGLEFGAQVDLGDFVDSLSGFGIIANATWEDDSGTSDISSVTGENLPFPGLSEFSYNVSGYYENDFFSARLAYNWRDDFLITASGRGGIPEFQEAYGQLDGSVSVDFNENVSVFADLINITNEVRLENSSSPYRRNYVETFGRKLFVGARVTF